MKTNDSKVGLTDLPNELLKQDLGAFLGGRDIVAMSKVSHRFYNLFQENVKKAKVEKILGHVVDGEQIKAEAMLRESPHLLIEKGDVTDDSGRAFHNISPWECMLWALDTRYMGQMMLSCIPAGEEGQAIRLEMAAQYDAMQGGGNDIVKLDGDAPPKYRSFSEIAALFENHDAILFWNNEFYYANKTDSSLIPITPSLTEENTAAFDAVKTLFQKMSAGTARKSNDTEHALIAKILGHTLERRGIHYEQEVPYKQLVKLDDDGTHPEFTLFEDISCFFDNEDAILFWKKDFYYANKADRSITLIPPIMPMTEANLSAFVEFKTSLMNMPPNSTRQASEDEHALIKSAFINQGLVHKTLHYCDSHYDFRVIDALQTYIDCFYYHYPTKKLQWQQRDILWLEMAKKQRDMPAHVIHHCCDPNKALFPLPNFKAESLARTDLVHFYTHDRKASPEASDHLFSAGFLFSDLGFQFALALRPKPLCGAQMSVTLGGPGPEEAARILNALRKLYEVRMDDTKLLRDSLRLGIELIPNNPG